MNRGKRHSVGKSGKYSAQATLERLDLDLAGATQVAAEIRESRQDSIWISDHYEGLLKQYPQEYVAVYRGKVVGHDRDCRKLKGQLKDRDPVTARRAVVEYIDERFDFCL